VGFRADRFGMSSRRPPQTTEDLIAPLRTRRWLSEARRKSLHLASLILPLWILYQPLPWPHSKRAWVALILSLTAIALTIDVIRVNDDRTRRGFKRFFGEMIREHEAFSLLGSTYLLIAAWLALELFPRPLAAAALGFTILGDGFAALVGKAWGRRRFFHKTLEGAAGGLIACLLWAVFLVSAGHLTWPVALAGALVASLVELLPIPLDDNLGMTLISGYVMRQLWMGQ
jgi:glycerol-3-phosphate acyltransferase PlsY